MVVVVMVLGEGGGAGAGEDAGGTGDWWWCCCCLRERGRAYLSGGVLWAPSAFGLGLPKQLSDVAGISRVWSW